jgi:methylated-DNA-[protein]-cysteine S-methyltransferase
MAAHGFICFDTAIGECALAWGEHGLVGVLLPEGRGGANRARLARRFPDAVETEPPAGIGAAVAEITALLRGEPADLSAIALDLTQASDFERRVYAIVRAIPPGKTRTYGEIAAQLGDRLEARAVGQAMGKNPFPIVVPCHRVLGAGGRLGGFSAPGGAGVKLRMLAIEGALSPAALPLFADRG